MRKNAYGIIMPALLALALGACTSSHDRHNKNLEQATANTTSPANSPAAQSSSGPWIDLNCVVDHLQNPPESFHYLYKKDSSSPVHQEADLTPQTIDGLRVDINGLQHPLHALRSDAESWQSALAGLTGISGMSSTVALINHNSAMHREADGGQVNGYNTIHYSIDTARFDPTESHMLLNTGDFEKGDAWVTPDGCPVKFGLDSELHRKDGALIEKIHYEVAMVKK